MGPSSMPTRHGVKEASDTEKRQEEEEERRQQGAQRPTTDLGNRAEHPTAFVR